MIQAKFAAREISTSKATATIAMLIVGTLISPLAHAQVEGRTLSGLVADESGAVVAGAKVSIRNPASGTGRDVSTNAHGLYAAPNFCPALTRWLSRQTGSRG